MGNKIRKEKEQLIMIFYMLIAYSLYGIAWFTVER